MSETTGKNNKRPHLFEARIITLGESTVGKTSLILRFVEDRFTPFHVSTHGIDSKIKYLTMENGIEIKVRLTDTAGQERYKSLATNYIKKANGILLIYDITNKDTFESLKKILKTLNEEYQDSMPIILIGNKSDLEEKRVIFKEDGDEIAKSNSCIVNFYETSCKTGENVEVAIKDLATQVYKKHCGNNNEGNNDNIQINKDHTKKNNKKKCC